MKHAWEHALKDGHALIAGGTRKGKSGLLQLMSRAIIRRGLDGITAIDPHGEFARAVAEWLANPQNRVHDRRVHILDPGSSNAFGANPLEPYDDSWEACHDAAVLLSSIIESRFNASPEETPRLTKIVYCAGMVAARKKLTVLEMLEFLSLGAEELRMSLLRDFDNRVVRRELDDLFLLAEKQPARFLEYIESTKNRFVRLLGDHRLARILGQRNGINPRAVMDGREIVLADLSALSASDAAFVGTLLTSMYVAAAKRRPPIRCARHRMILDEGESLITVDVARMVDQCAKYGLNLIVAIQRLGQLRAKGDFICDALLTNTALKIVFGLPESESAQFMARQLFTGFVDLEEWKRGSARPTVTGQDKTTVKNRSRADHQAEHESASTTHARSRANARGTVTGSTTGTTTTAGTNTSSGQMLTAGTDILGNPAMLGQSAGESASNSASESTLSSFAESDVEIEGESVAISTVRGKSRGSSDSHGESECFISHYELLPMSMYSLEEQLHRLTGEIMKLPRRWCFVKVDTDRPYKTRTQDLAPTFRSIEFKRVMLPAFLRATAARSPYLLPATDIDTAIAARLAELNAPLPVIEPDLASRESFKAAADLRALLDEASEPKPQQLPDPPQRPSKNRPAKKTDKPPRGFEPKLVSHNDDIPPRHPSDKA